MTNLFEESVLMALERIFLGFLFINLNQKKTRGENEFADSVYTKKIMLLSDKDRLDIADKLFTTSSKNGEKKGKKDNKGN